MLGSIHANQFFLGFYTQFGEDPDDTGTDQGADHSHCNGDADAGQLSQEQVYVAKDQAVPLGNRVDVAAGEQAGGDAAQIPPMPWQPKASRASSIFSFCFSRLMPKKHKGLTTAPIIKADQTGT